MGTSGSKIIKELQPMVSDLLSNDFLGYPISKFASMPPATDIKMIAKAMLKISNENKEINGINYTSFGGSSINLIDVPYMELLIPDDSNEKYYVYSSTNGDGRLFTTNSNELVIEDSRIFQNPFRFYVLNSIIFNLSVETTEQFPETKEFSFKNGTVKQQMELRAATVPSQDGAYVPTTISRNTIYVYYPGTTVYTLVDTKTSNIYVMQTGNNQKVTNPLTYNNMINIQLTLSDTLPEGMLFLSSQIPDDQTVCVVSSPKYPAVLMQDVLGNSYQLADKEYAKCLYDSLI